MSKAFGAPGTPSAVAIDEQGRVASAVMVGGDATLDVLDAETPDDGAPTLPRPAALASA